MKKILIIDGHPNKDSLNAALASAYKRGALESGAEVKEITMKSRILELSKDGKTTKEIKVLLEEEGWASKMKCGKIRPIYINLVIKNN